MRKSDIAHSIDEQQPPHSIRSRLRSAALTAGAVLLGAVGLYSTNNIPFLYFDSVDRVYWFNQFAAFIGYTILALSIWASGKATEHITHNIRYATVAWGLAIGTILAAMVSAVTLTTIIFPLFELMTGVEWDHAIPLWILTNLLGVGIHASVLMNRSARKQREHHMRVQLETDGLGTALDRAELSMLEAQIEPHFLFNTLAHIKRQYRMDAISADSMLGALIDYLDRALPALRREDWQVGDELELIQVYLEILQQRFGKRLTFHLTASDASKSVRLPALTIATLVENAVRHGIAPKPDGGKIVIDANIEAGTLQIDVCDSGVGLKESSGSCLGLMTLRARLRSAFGAQAVLMVQPSPVCGVRASIRVPLGGAT